jgi:DNA topoisomerase I
VCSARGHLYAVDSKGTSTRSAYPIWDYRWAPKHEFEKISARLVRWVRVIESIATNADRYINACDYDIEGSVIGYTVLQYACKQTYAKSLRMKFSTMTEKELRNAYQKLDPKPDLPLVDAGKARHELDWLYGINISRLLTTSALKQGRGYATLSTGRVQGPTLHFVVEREKEIACFVPFPFWTIDATIIDESQIYPIEYEKEKISSQLEAKNVCDSCRNASLDVKSNDSHSSQQYPPFPFDLSTLQLEAYRHFGYTPARTLAIAERLYLDALISYPRTSSQKLPPDIGYSDILRGIAAQTEYRPLAAKLSALAQLRPYNGSKEDPAHPAIYPTIESPKKSLFGPEAKLYDLITRRFMATFAETSIKMISRIFLEHEKFKFTLSGSKIVKLGWIEYYRPYVVDDSRLIPDLKIGDRVKVHQINSIEKFTRPPFRYNPSSLLRKMEDANIGTKATRAGIIDLLYQRGYVRDERMRPSELADNVTEVMSVYCPLMLDPSFTANLEDLMQQIQDETISRRLVLVEALERLRQVMLSLVENEMEIGSRLSQVIVAQRVADVTFDSPCPKCGLKLSVVRSRGSGKRFVGCAGKWENGCNFTLPLPQFGALTLLSKRCKTCGFQMIQARSKGRRPLVSCPLCYKTKLREPSSFKESHVGSGTTPRTSIQPA